MVTQLLGIENKPRTPEHQEGELYKIVTTFGKTFELRYGYYGEKDRQNPLCKPDVVYPDFTVAPQYTDHGEPFVTVVQDVCGNYKGKNKKTPDTTCEECQYFKAGKDWFGICTCAKNKKTSEAKEVVQNE